jgi:uncharacterized protein
MFYLFFAASLFAAGIGAELVGFGISAILMSFLPLILPLSTVIPLVAIISLVATGIVAWKTKTIGLSKYLWPLLVGSLVGVPLGLVFLQIISEAVLTLVLGGLLIIYVLFNLFFKGRRFLGAGRIGGLLMGVLAGFFDASFNVSGPLVGMYLLSNDNLSKYENKDLITTYMFLTGLVIVAGHAIFGRLNREVSYYSLLSLPFLFLGIWVGQKLFAKTSSLWVKRIIYAVVFLSGVLILVK